MKTKSKTLRREATDKIRNYLWDKEPLDAIQQKISETFFNAIKNEVRRGSKATENLSNDECTIYFDKFHRGLIDKMVTLFVSYLYDDYADDLRAFAPTSLTEIYYSDLCLADWVEIICEALLIETDKYTLELLFDRVSD